jgi:sortase family protein
VFSNKRGLRKLRSFKNKADSKAFNSQSDEGRELAQTQIFQPRQAQRTRTSVKTHRRYSKISKINSRNKAKNWHFSKSCIIPALLLLASFASLIYPHAAMWLSQYHMSEVAAEYAKLITHAVPAPHEQLARAREYNQKLSSGAIYEANTNIPTSHGETSDASQDYWEQLKANDDGLMARLRIKKIDLDLPVYHGTEDATLLKGLGHLRGTSLPVGGKGTRSVITGHRGLASAEMFTRLDEIVKGDTFTIEVFDEILTYKVVDKIVVNPDETKKIAAVPGKDLVTLITCTPLGINTQRILVTGERVVPTPAADKSLRGKKPDVPRFPWWVLGCFGSLCVVGGYVWWAGLPVKKKKKEDEEDSEKDKKEDSAKDGEEDSAASSAKDNASSAVTSAATSAVRRENLAREEARAIANRPKKRPKVKKSSSRKKRKRGSRGEKTFDWLINILGL